jgi:hypothetical protein
MKFKMEPLTDKLMLSIFWDSQGPILETYAEHETTVKSSATYYGMLQRDLILQSTIKEQGDCRRASCC